MLENVFFLIEMLDLIDDLADINSVGVSESDQRSKILFSKPLDVEHVRNRS
jgi:hypothetical protein